MAEKKLTVTKQTKSEDIEAKYKKEQLITASRYHNRKDLVDALLDENKEYTIETVDMMIEKFMKGQVK